MLLPGMGEIQRAHDRLVPTPLPSYALARKLRYHAMHILSNSAIVLRACSPTPLSPYSKQPRYHPARMKHMTRSAQGCLIYSADSQLLRAYPLMLVPLHSSLPSTDQVISVPEGSTHPNRNAY
eukprot:105924-Rhodomonas_salina.2